jgi:hypothetical protein
LIRQIAALTLYCSRLPVKAREYTRTVALFLTNSGEITNAYASGTDIAIRDSADKGGLAHETLMLHENAHTIDFNWEQVHGGFGWVSGKTKYGRLNL